MVNPKKPGIGDQTPEATAIWVSFSRLRSAIAAVANKGADRIANMVLLSRGGIHFLISSRGSVAKECLAHSATEERARGRRGRCVRRLPDQARIYWCRNTPDSSLVPAFPMSAQGDFRSV